MIPAPRIPWWTAIALSGAGGLMLAVFLAPRRDLPVQPRPAADGGVLRIAHAWPLTVDPHYRSFPLPAQSQFTLGLWEPLVECDPGTGQPRPAAAESWRWSDDRLTLTMQLRRDGRWSNGEPVTAKDFVRSWRRLIMQRAGAATVLFPLRHAAEIHGRRRAATELGVEAVDDFTLRISLTDVRSTFVAELADPLLVPMHATTPVVLAGEALVSAPEKLVTNGAFRLVRVEAGKFRLGASPHYRDRAAVRLTGVDFIHADNMSVARLLVAVGRADVAAASLPRMLAGMPTDRSVKEANEMTLSITSLNLNTARGPLRDVRVRRALALAVNRGGPSTGAFEDMLVPAHAWVPDMPGRPTLPLFHEDVAEARRLLAEAGYPGGRGFPVLLFPINPRRENYAYYQAWIERWYSELGVRTYLAPTPPDRRKARSDRGDFDVMMGGLVATVPDAGDLLGVFAHPERFGMPQWANPEITRLMTEADRLSGHERLALLERIERQVMADVPAIPLMFERRRTLLAEEVEGWYPDPLGRQALRHLAIRPSTPAASRQEEPL